MCNLINIHTYIHAYIHTYIHNTYIQHTYKNTYIHINTYTHTCIHTYMHVYIHTYIHTCIHTCIHTYIHTGIIDPPLGGSMRVAYNDSDDRAGLRGYVQFNRYTYIHTYMTWTVKGQGRSGSGNGG